MEFILPTQGIVFWPIGTGDSTTIVAGEGCVIQIDLHHLACADKPEDARYPIVDRLVESLPKRNGRPYLEVFGVTHTDKDHCLGFKALKDQVDIGELIFTPQIFHEEESQCCEDAIAFIEEAKRRVQATIEAGGCAGDGDRVRLIGYDDLLQEEEYCGFPSDCLSIPGHTITRINGVERQDISIFALAPFKDDCGGPRNDSSFAVHVTLRNGNAEGRALLLGDLSYPFLERIFSINWWGGRVWDVLLAPHHCSKSVMYWRQEGSDEETLQQGLLDKIEAAAGNSAYIVASCDPIPDSNHPSDNPPHAIARARYRELVAAGHFLCTQEYPNLESPEPLVFIMTTSGLQLQKPADSDSKKSKADGPKLGDAITAARGNSEPPKDRVGFGVYP